MQVQALFLVRHDYHRDASESIEFVGGPYWNRVEAEAAEKDYCKRVFTGSAEILIKDCTFEINLDKGE